MNKELKGVVTDLIVERITNLLEDMSTNEFIELVVDNYYKETGKNLEDELPEDSDVHEVVHELVGEKVFPLFGKLSEYIVETHLK